MIIIIKKSLRWQWGKPKYPGSHWSQFTPAMWFLQEHWPVVWLQEISKDPSGWHIQSENWFQWKKCWYVSIFIIIEIDQTFTIWMSIISLKAIFTIISTNVVWITQTMTSMWITKVVSCSKYITCTNWE